MCLENITFALVGSESRTPAPVGQEEGASKKKKKLFSNFVDLSEIYQLFIFPCIFHETILCLGHSYVLLVLIGLWLTTNLSQDKLLFKYY